jgi:two-component system chemotaxis response regulator CheY
MVTAVHQQALVNKAVDAGARDYIAKPFDGQKVLETVRKIVG